MNNDTLDDSRVDKITVVGAGLVGSLFSIFLARRNYQVQLLERRPDMRKQTVSAGRSINLAISTRGINALKKLDLDGAVLSHAVAMKGRMIHAQNSQLTFQPYGTDESQYINSISRATLNKLLMDHAEADGVEIMFNQRVTGIDLQTNTLEIVNEQTKQQTTTQCQLVSGTDGSASAIREGMLGLDGYKCDMSDLDYGYKELVIPPGPDGQCLLERNSLHIWPRGMFMLIALPNYEGSFTCTLFLPWKGNISFEQLTTPARVRAFFEEQFPDSIPLISNLEETFFQNPTGHMTTVKCNRWNVGGKVLLLGDAAHGIVPFFGQGMNCGFEDCTIFDETIERFTADGKTDWASLFDEMTRLRVPNTDAIADMAVENFIEMRDKVGDAHFLLEKAVEKILQKQFPGRYISRYSLVTFSNVPYTLARNAGVIEDEILCQLCQGLEKPEHVNLSLAEQLIDERLAPLLLEYSQALVAVGGH